MGERSILDLRVGEEKREEWTEFIESEHPKYDSERDACRIIDTHRRGLLAAVCGDYDLEAVLRPCRAKQ